MYYSTFWKKFSGIPAHQLGQGPYRDTWAEADNDGRAWLATTGGGTPEPNVYYYYTVESNKCFLEAAFSEALHLPANCYQLAVLREFRSIDISDSGTQIIRKYEIETESLLKYIERSRDRKLLYAEVCATIHHVVAALERKDWDTAIRSFESMLTSLVSRRDEQN